MASELNATPAPPARVGLLTLLALCAFAGNSLLCRLALTRTTIDAASFTTIRLVSGAVVLLMLVRLRAGGHRPLGSWVSALALFVYAAAFSFAYLTLTAGTGALLLFGAVQATMISVGVMRGERLTMVQGIGLLFAYVGLIGLVLPGLSAPPVFPAALMLTAGAAWGVYSLRGKGAGDPTAVTAGNFMRAVPMAIALSVATSAMRTLDLRGIVFAVASGALASGVGYAIWYTALRGLRATNAATVQLSVPVMAALSGVVLLHEPLTTRLVVAGAAILGGVAMVVLTKRNAVTSRQVVE